MARLDVDACPVMARDCCSPLVATEKRLRRPKHLAFSFPVTILFPSAGLFAEGALNQATWGGIAL